MVTFNPSCIVMLQSETATIFNPGIQKCVQIPRYIYSTIEVFAPESDDIVHLSRALSSRLTAEEHQAFSTLVSAIELFSKVETPALAWQAMDALQLFFHLQSLHADHYEWQTLVNRESTAIPNTSFPTGDFRMAFSQAVRERASDSAHAKETLGPESLRALLSHSFPLQSARPYPSAGGIYSVQPFIAFLRDFSIEHPRGLYRVDNESLQFEPISNGGVGLELLEADCEQLRNYRAALLISADAERHCAKYGPWGLVFAFMEVGAATQSVYLSCSAAGVKCRAFGRVAQSNDLTFRKLMKFSDSRRLYLLLGLDRYCS